MTKSKLSIGWNNFLILSFNYKLSQPTLLALSIQLLSSSTKGTIACMAVAELLCRIFTLKLDQFTDVSKN